MEQQEQLERHRGLSEDDSAEGRRRLQREAERMKVAERDEVLRAWLPVVDNIERALASGWKNEDPLHQGVVAIHKQMMQILKGYRVRRVPGVGVEPSEISFDPHLHEAVATVEERPGQRDGSVAEVMEPGYVIEDRVLRTAKVTTVRRQEQSRGG
jgi:molecular chaperone GrpE